MNKVWNVTAWLAAGSVVTYVAVCSYAFLTGNGALLEKYSGAMLPVVTMALLHLARYLPQVADEKANRDS